MKTKLLLILIAFFVAHTIFAQNGFNYKALITDNGNMLNTQSVDLKFTILQSGTTSVYQETQSATTDANGILAVNIGEGAVQSGDFNTIDWSANTYFLKVEIDTGSGYTDFGTTEFKAVPYAKYADKAGNTFSGNFTDLNGVPAGLADGDDVNDADHSSTNELQTLAFDNASRQLSITNGNTIAIPAGGDDWGTQVATTNGSINGDGTSGSPLGVNTSDAVFNGWDKNASDDFDGDFTHLTNVPTGLADGDDDTQLTETQVDNYVSNNGYLTSEVDGSTTNELQSLSLSTNQLSISNGNTVTFTGWDTNVNDDFSGNYNDLSNKPSVFVNSSNNPATAVNEDIYHTGRLSLGNGNFGSWTSNSNLRLYKEITGINGGRGISIEVKGSGSGNHTAISSSIDNTGGSAATGLYTSLDGNTDAMQDGIYNYFTSSGNGPRRGVLNWIVSSGDGNHVGMDNILSGDGHGIHLGIENNLTGDGNGKKYGVVNYISGNGSADHYGNYSFISGDGTGKQYGNYTEIMNTGDALHFGAYHKLSGGGSGNHFGTYNDLQGNGTGWQCANYNKITANGNTGLTGVHNEISGYGNRDHYGIENTLTGTGSGFQTGVNNAIDNSGNGIHYGSSNSLSGQGTGIHYGTYNELFGTGTGEQYGNFTNIYNSGNANHYGSYNQLSGNGSGQHYGTYNLLEGNGEGLQFGNFIELSGAGRGKRYGNYIKISNTNGYFHYGTYNFLSGNSNASQYALYANIPNSGNGTHYGLYNNIYGDGLGKHYGIYNNIRGDGTGKQFGIKNQISNTKDEDHYGVYSALYGAGSGKHYGTYNELSGSGSGRQYGIYNVVNNTGDNYHFAVYNTLNGVGTHNQYGTYNKLFGAGSGSQVGTINEMDSTGNGSIFAECNLISSSATGTGNKYGIYSSIDSNAGGIHYALYASAPKSGSYAGYFNGDVNVKGKLKATRSGDSDMKAYVYGLVYYNGNIDSNRSSSGFSIHKSGTGTYEVTLSGVTNQNYIVSATAEIGGAGTAVIATTDYSSTTNGKFIIRIYQLSGALLNNSFHFVVYKK